MRNDEALTVDEVAEILQVSRNTVYALKNRGELASFKVGRKLRFSYTDVQAYIAKSKTSREPEVVPVKQGGRFVICGQDVILDVLSNYVTQAGVECLLHRQLRRANRAVQGRRAGGVGASLG